MRSERGISGTAGLRGLEGEEDRGSEHDQGGGDGKEQGVFHDPPDARMDIVIDDDALDRLAGRCCLTRLACRGRLARPSRRSRSRCPPDRTSSGTCKQAYMSWSSWSPIWSGE
jgi:hypothetical protein